MGLQGDLFHNLIKGVYLIAGEKNKDGSQQLNADPKDGGVKEARLYPGDQIIVNTDADAGYTLKYYVEQETRDVYETGYSFVHLAYF